MKRKFNTKGFVKDTLYGFMDGGALALSWIVSAFNLYGTVYCFKNKQYRSSAKWFAWLTAVATFNAARNTWLTYKHINGEICAYDFMIVTNDDEDEEVDEI